MASIDRYIPTKVNSENFESPELRREKSSRIVRYESVLAQALFPNADTRVFSFSQPPDVKPYLFREVKSEPMPTVVRGEFYPSVSKDFFEKGLTATSDGRFISCIHNINGMSQVSKIKSVNLDPIVFAYRSPKVKYIQYSKDNQQLFIIENKTVLPLDLNSGRGIQIPEPNGTSVDDLDANLIAIGKNDATVVFYDLRKRESINTVRVPKGDGISGNVVTKCVSSENKYFAIGTGGGNFVVHDLRMYTVLMAYRFNSAIRAIDFETNGSHVFFGGGGNDQRLRSIQLISGDPEIQNLPTYNIGTQITKIKALPTSKGSNIWVATATKGIELVRYIRESSSFEPVGNILKGRSRILDFEIMGNDMIALQNDISKLVHLKMPPRDSNKRKAYTRL